MDEVEELGNDRADAPEVPRPTRPAQPRRQRLLGDVRRVSVQVHVGGRWEEHGRRARRAALGEVGLLVARIFLVVLVGTELDGIHEHADDDLVRALPLRCRDEGKMSLVQVAHRRHERYLCAGLPPRRAPLLEFLRVGESL